MLEFYPNFTKVLTLVNSESDWIISKWFRPRPPHIQTTEDPICENGIKQETKENAEGDF